MSENKNLMVKKGSFLKEIINKIKKLFKKEDLKEIVKIQEKTDIDNLKNKIIDKNRDFFDNIKVEENSEIVYLKIKLENGEVKAIDLTDEQIDELQKIYDKEIEEKKNKIIKLKGIA